MSGKSGPSSAASLTGKLVPEGDEYPGFSGITMTPEILIRCLIGKLNPSFKIPVWASRYHPSKSYVCLRIDLHPGISARISVWKKIHFMSPEGALWDSQYPQTACNSNFRQSVNSVSLRRNGKRRKTHAIVTAK